MLYMPKTRFVKAHTRNLHPQSVLVDEGVALVSATGGTVKTGTGLAGEKFAGIAVFQRGPLLSLPKFDTAHRTTVANKVFKLTNTPLGGTLVIRNAVTNAKLADTTDYTYDAATNQVTYVNDGVVAIASYEYSPSMIEARVLQGDVQPGGTVPANYQWTGVIAEGDVYTTAFELADDWTDPNAVIRVGANGKLTTQGTGAVVDAYVIGVPNQETPFLGICLR